MAATAHPNCSACHELRYSFHSSVTSLGTGFHLAFMLPLQRLSDYPVGSGLLDFVSSSSWPLIYSLLCSSHWSGLQCLLGPVPVPLHQPPLLGPADCVAGLWHDFGMAWCPVLAVSELMDRLAPPCFGFTSRFPLMPPAMSVPLLWFIQGHCTCAGQ